MKRKRTLVLVGLLAVAVCLVVATGASAGFRQPTVQWPAFTMVYEDWRYGLGVNGAPGTQQFKLVYDDATHWRYDILAHSAAPERVGAWASYDGKQVRGFDPVFGASETDLSDERGIHTPNEWLWPNYIPNLLKKPNVQVVTALEPGTQALMQTEYIPCQTEATEQDRHAQLGPCMDGQRESRREIVFRELLNIPLQITDTVSGVVVQRITVQALTLR